MLKYLIILIVCINALFKHVSYAEEAIYEETIVTLSINNEQLDELCNVIRTKVGDFLILSKDIEPLNLNEAFIKNTLVNIHDKEYINISKLEGTKVDFDEAGLDLKIILSADKFNKQFFNFDPIIIHDKDVVNKEINGAFLNYDFTLSNTSQLKYITGIQDFNYFTSKGVLNHSFFTRNEFAKKRSIEPYAKKNSENKIIRLNTNWTFDDANSIARWRIGDSITKAADWSASSRFFGVQYSTNFAIRPNLVTHPLLNFTGRAELPSTLDIYANSIPMFSSQSRTGDYELANMPVPSGQGELMIKAQDITGKIQTFILPYYVPANLLAKDLSDFSFDVGMQRQNFGNEMSSYRYIITNADYLKGITNKWTSGIHFESLQNHASIGVTNNVQLGSYGIVSSSFATNLNNLKDSQKIVLGYTYQHRKFSYSSSVTLNSKNYRDIYYHATQKPTSKSYYSSISYHSDSLGDFGLNYMSFYTHDSFNKEDKIKVITGIYTKNIKSDTVVRMTIGSNLKRDDRSNFIYIGLSKNFGSKGIDISNLHEKAHNVKRIDYSAPVNTPLGWGYRTSVMQGKTNDYDLQFDNRSQKLDTSLYLYKYGAESNQQIGFTGAVVFIDKDFYLTKSIYDSLALVRIGNFKNIPIYHNNLKTGYTNSKGKVLIPNIISYTTSEIKINPKKLPLDTNIDSTVIKVSPGWKSGVLVDFNVRKIRSIEVVLLDSAKHIIKFDQEVQVEGITEELFVGYDGKLYINDIGNLQTLKGKTCRDEDNCCQFSAEIDKNNTDPIIDLGEVICH